MIDVEKNKNDFKLRYEYYRERVEQVVYPESEFDKISHMEHQKYGLKSDSEILKTIRTNLLTQKYNHSLRVEEVIHNLNSIMGNKQLIMSLSRLSGLIHDYGRFIQAVYHNSYYEAEKFYRQHGYNGHGEIGSHLLFDLGDIKYFHVDEKYYHFIEPVVKYHQINKLEGNLNLRFDNNSSDKWQIISLMIQMVKDADMYDILYQRINGEYPLFSKIFDFHVNGMTIDEISQVTNIGVDEIMFFNNLQSKDISNLKTVELPLEKVDPKLLEVPQEIKDKFYKMVYITNPSEWDLYKMQNNSSYNYNSITAMWWSVGQFLSNTNFTATLQLMKRENLLQRIYDLYPDNYKYLVGEMFDFASTELLEKRIIEGSIYSKTL